MNIREIISLLEDAATTEESPVRRWIAGSEFVDAQGNPITFYHGTSKDQDFRAFKMPKNGIWFTPDRNSASEYALENDSMDLKYDGKQYNKVHTASRVIPVYIKAQKVQHWADWPDSIKHAQNYRRAQGMLFDQLRMQGFDAINFANAVIVVIGSPNQIKSALGNKGTYDPAKKNIDEDDA